MKKVLGTSTLVAVLLALLSVSAGAGAVRCRSDPTVLLSDGTVLDLSADISALLWDVTAVSYTIHVPAGVGIVAAIRTPDWPTTKESFSLVADSTPGCYRTTTLVRTSASGVDVTANLIVGLRFASASGLSGHPIALAIEK